MRLGTKIIIGFFCISLLLACIGLISDSFTSSVRQEQLRQVNDASKVVIFTGEMESNLYQSLISLNAIRESMKGESNAETVQEMPPVRELKDDFEKGLHNFEHAFAKLRDMLGNDNELPENVNQLMKSFEVYKSISHEWLKLGADNFDQANLMFITSIEPYFRNNIIPHISELRSFVLSMQEGRNQELNRSLEQVDTANTIATMISIMLAVALAVYIYKSIANPLTNLNMAVTKLGEGNLAERIEVTSKDELGELAGAFNKMAASLEQKTVTKEYVDNIIESIHEAIFVSDIDGNVTRFNTAAVKLLGYNSNEMLNKSLVEFFDVEVMDNVVSEPKVSYEFNLVRKNEAKVPVLFSRANLMDTQGQMIGTVSVASDISHQKQMEEDLRSSLREKEVMLAEIHHRVKNNLAVITGLLQLQSFSTSDEEVKKALTDSQLRIQSIALVHEMLYENESLAYIQYDNYITDLLQAISSMYLNEKDDIHLISDVEPIKLTINQAIPCSLLLNELIVNSFKHAFKDTDSGSITVRIRQIQNRIELTTSDTGTGFDIKRFNSSETLGATLIKTLTNQLKGEFEILSDNVGTETRFKVTFNKED